MLNEILKSMQNLDKLADKITNILLFGNDVVLVGKSDAGKSHFAINVLLKKLTDEGLAVQYFEDSFSLPKTIPAADVYIVDEVELLCDCTYLEEKYGKDYYSKEYKKRASASHKKFSNLNTPTVFIVTRNNVDERTFIESNCNKPGWKRNRIAKVVIFEYR